MNKQNFNFEEFFKNFKEQLNSDEVNEMFDREVEDVKKTLEEKLVIGFFGTASSGKDSALKAIFGIESDEISPVPGSTTDVKVFPVPNSHILLLNAPGFGDAKSELSGKAREVINDVDIFIYIVNAQGGAKEQEVKDYNELKQTGKDVLVVLNKIDLIKPEQLDDLVEHTKTTLCVEDENFVLAAFDPMPQIMEEPYGLEDVYNWIIDKLEKKGKDLLFAKACRKKDLVCEKLIRRYAFKAFGIGAIPVPTSDIFLLLPLQIKMGLNIASIYNVSMENKNQIKQLIMNILAGNIGKQIFRAAISFAKSIEFIPGGQVFEIVICAIAGTVAASTTYALGKVFQFNYKNQGKIPLKDLQEIFINQYNDYKKKQSLKESIKNLRNKDKSKDIDDDDDIDTDNLALPDLS